MIISVYINIYIYLYVFWGPSIVNKKHPHMWIPRQMEGTYVFQCASLGSQVVGP